jgi:hypothetical protein
VDPLVAIGDWVERDQAIVQARIPVYDAPQSPPGWQFWVNDSTSLLDFEMFAPCSGLVVDMQEVICAYHGDSRATHSGRSLCYGNCSVLPTILIPTDEPPLSTRTTFFYESVARSLKVNFRQLLHSHRDGYRRFAESFPDFAEDDQNKMKRFLDQSEIVQANVTIKPVADVRMAEHYIVKMRAHDPSLRKKLTHIGGVAQV